MAAPSLERRGSTPAAWECESSVAWSTETPSNAFEDVWAGAECGTEVIGEEGVAAGAPLARDSERAGIKKSIKENIW